MSESDGKTATSVLTAVRRTLATAELGYNDMIGDDVLRRIPGMHNFLTFSRSVTFVLQNLRSIVDGFDDWYSPYATEMEATPAARRFKQLRNELEKQGTTRGVGNSLHINHLNTDDLQPLLQHPPPGAKGFFIGDQNGGNGWEIEVGGQTEHYYVELPPHVAKEIRFDFVDSNDGVYTTLRESARAHLDYLNTMLARPRIDSSRRRRCRRR
jgi:hypothetical protein